MAYPQWDTAGSQYSTVTGSSQKFSTALDEGSVYCLSANCDLWFTVDVTGGSASKAAGSHYMASGDYRLLSPTSDGDLFVHVIQDTAGGDASLSKVILP